MAKTKSLIFCAYEQICANSFGTFAWSLRVSTATVLTLLLWVIFRRVARNWDRTFSHQTANIPHTFVLSCIAAPATAISYSDAAIHDHVSSDCRLIPALWASVALLVTFTTDYAQLYLLCTFHISMIVYETSYGVNNRSVSLCVAAVASLSVILRCLLERHSKVAKTTSASDPVDSSKDVSDDSARWKSVYSFLTLSWLSPLVVHARTHAITKSQLSPLTKRLASSEFWSSIRQEHGEISLVSELLRLSRSECLTTMLVSVVHLCCVGMLPSISSRMISSIDNSSVDRDKAFYFTFAFLFLGITGIQLDMLQRWASRSCHQRVRGILLSQLTAVILYGSRPAESTHERTAEARIDSAKEPTNQSYSQNAEFLTALRNDANELADLFLDLHKLIQTPLSLLLSVTLIWNLLGPACLLGSLSLIAAQFINIRTTRALLNVGRARAAARDARSRTMLELLTNIRFLRWYDFQKVWLDKVLEARAKEKDSMLAFDLTQIRLRVINLFGSSVFPIVALYFYTRQTGATLTVEVIYPAFWLFNLMESRIKEVPELVANVTRAIVAVQKLQKLHNVGAQKSYQSNLPVPGGQSSSNESHGNGKTESEKKPASIQLKGSFSWPYTDSLILRDVDLVFRRGMNLVHGPVGGGKTALLLATIGEMIPESSSLRTSAARFAYCSQNPWLQSLSIRENICFESPFTEQKYREVLNVCDLNSDFKDLPRGDLTFLGERGIGLSGGQKARIALARALYSQPDVLVLDDPFSALDNSTAQTIVSKLGQSALTEKSIIVLATHRRDLVQDLCVQSFYVSDGCVTSQLKTGTGLGGKQEKKHTTEQSGTPDKSTEVSMLAANQGKSNVDATPNANSERPIWTYIRSGKTVYWSLLVIALILSQALDLSEVWYRQRWSGASKNTSTIAGRNQAFDSSNLAPLFQAWLPRSLHGTNGWLLGLAGISILRPCSSMMFMLAEAFLSYDISRRLFDHALRSVAGAKLTFYDKVSTGDLLSRFEADIATIDGTICGQVVRFAMFTIILCTSIIAVLAIAPPMLLVSAIVSGFVVHVFWLYQPASQKLRKLERSSYAPVLSQLNEIIDGAATIRAFNAEEHMRKSWSAALDTSQNFDYHYFALQSWLAYRIDMLTACSECVLILLAIYQGHSASTVSVGAIIAREFVGSLELLCRSLKGLQTSSFSVERIQELIQLKQEPKGTIEPDDGWPRKGSVILFEDVTLEYADTGAPAIRNINLKLEDEQVIALVGRTGSGKTTLLQSLLGILTPKSGRICIDGIDLNEVDKSRLQRRVSYIAQDPVLFAGTIKENIDPLQEFRDDEILHVLTQANPKESWTLETIIEPGGSNFSLGERQIINLARAILRKSAIVLLDEATAAIDSTSEKIIQRLIQTELKDSRIISITHRKEMMESADRTIELANGEVIRDSSIGRGTS